MMKVTSVPSTSSKTPQLLEDCNQLWQSQKPSDLTDSLSNE